MQEISPGPLETSGDSVPPELVADDLPTPLAQPLAGFFGGKHFDDPTGKFNGRICYKEVFFWLESEAFRPNRSGDDGLSCCKRFEDFEAATAADSERNYDHGSSIDVR